MTRPAKSRSDSESLDISDDVRRAERHRPIEAGRARGTRMPMNPQDSSILTARAVVARVGAFTLLGLAAGFVLFAIETTDRLVVLRASVNRPAEALELALLLGSTVLGAGVLGFALGIVATPLEVVRQVLASALDRLRP